MKVITFGELTKVCLTSKVFTQMQEEFIEIYTSVIHNYSDGNSPWVRCPGYTMWVFKEMCLKYYSQYIPIINGTFEVGKKKKRERNALILITRSIAVVSVPCNVNQVLVTVGSE